MASTELIPSIGRAKKKPTFGQYVGDHFKMLGDTALSTLGLNDVISDDAYKTDFYRDASNILSPLAKTAGSVAMTLTGMPAGPAIFPGGGKRIKQLPSLYETNRQAFVDSVLNANQDKEWVRRLYPAPFRRSMNIFGDKSTHLMGHDGQGYAYPHIVKDNGKLMFLETDDEAGDYARKHDTGIQFKTPEQAAWFSSNGYKIGSGVLGKNLKPNLVYADGGLIEFDGPKHEEGGIQLGQDEVEGNETMMPMGDTSDFIFSDRLIVPGTKQTFAAKSKRINKKYSLRPNDKYSKDSMNLELNKLAELQEGLKEYESTPPEYSMEYADGGIYIKPSKRGTFTTAAKKHGLGVQEFARQVLANEDDYSSAMVKKANFARNAAKFGGGGGRGRIAGLDLSDPAGRYEGYAFNPIVPLGFTPNDNYTFKERPLRTFNDVYPDTVPEATFGMYNSGITTMTPKDAGQIKSDKLAFPTIKSIGSSEESYSSDFTIPALGYLAQASTNIPALLTKADKVKFPRVKFDDISLAEQRNESRRARNLGLASAREVGSTDAGQMMNYLSGTTAALNSVYGNQFNQSLLQEQQANAEMNMREQLANSEIERYDEQINAQERDAARALRMNALQNLGTIAAGAGRDYMAMQENDAMMNVLMGSNPDYTYDVNTPTGRMKWLKSKILTPKRRKV